MLLSKAEITSLVQENMYSVDPKLTFLSRDIDGRYANAPDLPALAIPGGDAGALLMLMIAGGTYGFAVDAARARESLVELVGGAADVSIAGDYLRLVQADPAEFEADAQLITAFVEQLAELTKAGAQTTNLIGGHREGAAIMVTGDRGVLPQFTPELGEHAQMSGSFILHKSFAGDRHRAWAKKLLETGAVTLYNGLDHEYLFEVLSSLTEDHYFLTLKKIAPGLPLYDVTFKGEDKFEVEEMGTL